MGAPSRSSPSRRPSGAPVSTRSSGWQTQIPYIQSLIESGRYPLLTRVVFDARAPHDPDRLEHGFDLGLERVLDGLATMLPS